MKVTAIVVASLCAACAPEPKLVQHQEVTVTVTEINWMFAGQRVERAYCSRTIGDCFQAMSQKCGALGYMAQTLGDHDAVFRCRPREVPADDGKGLTRPVE